MHAYVCVCLRACLVERYTKLKKNKKNKRDILLLSGKLFLLRGAKKKNEAIFFAVREMLPDKM